MNKPLALAFALSLLVLGSLAPAQVPVLFNHQGRVAVDGVNFEGSGFFKFALVNANGTTTYWTSSPDTTPADGVPDSALALTVTKGLYAILLGDTSISGMQAIPASVFANPDVRLRVWFDNGALGFQLLTPDQRLAPGAYLADAAVTSAKLADGAVGSTKIAAGAVSNTQLANSSLTVTAGSGLAGGGAVSLGGNVTLSNSGVLSLSSGGGITVDASTGAITLGSNATSANTVGTIVLRDGSGNFSAGTITAAFSGNGSALTSLNGANITTGLIADARLGTISTAGKVANSATTATSANTASAIVARDGSGRIFVSGAGIGTTSTNFPLMTRGNGTNDLIGLESNAGTLRWHLNLKGTGNADLDFVESGVAENRLFLQAGGAVGIGTATPSSRLEVNGTATATAFSGNGASLTSLNASNLASGTVADARLSSNVPLRNAASNTFAGALVVTTGDITASNGNLSAAGTNGSFGTFFFAPSSGIALGAILTAAGANGPQLRFNRGSDGAFVDIGQNATADFVVESNDVARLTIKTDGTLMQGSGTGTSEAPDKGVIVRRIKSTDTAAGQVVARTDKLTLERDGTGGGWRISYVANPGNSAIAATGLTTTGAAVNFYSAPGSPGTAGTITLFTDAQSVAYFRCQFGNPYDLAHQTTVELSRSAVDFYWTGTVTSTFNQ